MPTWPSTLPTPMVSGYSLKPGSALVRTAIEAGPARVRRRFTQVPTAVPVQFEMTLDELATFEAWFFHEIHQGAEWFALTLINGRGLATANRARIKVDDNGTPYEATPQGNGAVWTVKFELEVEGLPILSAAELAGRL